jgi:hypothetical protein
MAKMRPRGVRSSRLTFQSRPPRDWGSPADLKLARPDLRLASEPADGLRPLGPAPNQRTERTRACE